ncbi:MAG: ubiquinol-cytochrome C chaperone family protein [Alphaproteobacteria bacterium]|nr:ubiquinol-cytochrome C chaperone family protein [Alphaproteobacteria bacterium]
MIRSFFRTKLTREQKIALVLYEQIVTTARQPALYAKAGIPDTLEGRVESIALHTFLLFRRMTGRPGWDTIGGALSDEIVADFDRSLREMGVGDMSIGKKVKKLAQLFFGRFDAYWGAINGSEGAEDLDSVLKWGVFQGQDVDAARLAAMNEYFDKQSAHLFAQTEKNILVGRVTFTAPDPFFAALPDVQPIPASETTA